MQHSTVNTLRKADQEFLYWLQNVLVLMQPLSVRHRYRKKLTFTLAVIYSGLANTLRLNHTSTYSTVYSCISAER